MTPLSCEQAANRSVLGDELSSLELDPDHVDVAGMTDLQDLTAWWVFCSLLMAVVSLSAFFIP